MRDKEQTTHNKSHAKIGGSPTYGAPADAISEIRSKIKSKGRFWATKKPVNRVFTSFSIGAANGT